MIATLPSPSNQYDRANEAAFRRSVEQYLGQLMTEQSANGSFYSQSQSDARFAPLVHTHTFASLTSIPTTIAGYGITDFNSLGDARWALLGHTHTFASLTSKPTTIGGYGITDFNSLGDVRWGLKGSPNTWADYQTLSKYIKGGFGSETTVGTLDWNDSTNARSGQGHSLLAGTATNGPGPATLFHPFSFEYATKDGTGNLTQFAIPYANVVTKMFMRGRYLGTWGSWTEIITSSSLNGYGDARWSLLGHTHTFASLTSIPTTIAGYGITDLNSLGDARWLKLAGGTVNNTTGVSDIVIGAVASNVVQMALGQSSVVGSLGTTFSGGWAVLAHNATQTAKATDNWHQSLATLGSSAVFFKPTGVEFNFAAVGVADATRATFWGTPVATLSSAGAFNALGTISQAGVAVSLNGHTHTFASLTSKPTTIAGYGITDFNSLGDARWGLLASANAWSGANTFGASTAARATMNIAPGVAPTTPNNGDIWMTASGLFARINGVTEQLNGTILLE